MNLVYNPQGATLPPDQRRLETEYKRELVANFGIRFNQLFVLANMPIKRFGSMLVSKGQFEPYMNLLKDNFRTENLEMVMCKSLVSVDWQGYLYDCDFNQQLDLQLAIESKESQTKSRRGHLRDLLANDVAGKPITVADHCFGCTAGQGSSCSGAL